MRQLHYAALAVALTFRATCALAEPSAPASVVASKASTDQIAGCSQTSELGELDMCVARWKRLAEIAAFKATIAQSEGQGHAGGGNASAAASLAAALPQPTPSVGKGEPNVSPQTASKAPNQPSLLRVGSSGGRFDAQLEVDGRSIDAVEGDVVAVWIVVRITGQAVTLSRAGRLITLRV